MNTPPDYQRRRRERYHGISTKPIAPPETSVELAWDKERAGMKLKHAPSMSSWRDRNDSHDEAMARKVFKA